MRTADFFCLISFFSFYKLLPDFAQNNARCYSVLMLPGFSGLLIVQCLVDVFYVNIRIKHKDRNKDRNIKIGI